MLNEMGLRMSRVSRIVGFPPPFIVPNFLWTTLRSVAMALAGQPALLTTVDADTTGETGN